MKKNIIGLFTICLTLTSCNKNDDNQLTEFPSNYLNYQTQTELEIPFDEEWLVVWGGRTIEQNKHASDREQRFAMDIAQVIDGSTFTGNGNENEDYYCFGKIIYASGNGKIIAMNNTSVDNPPGTLNTNEPLGNYVIIDHLNGEFSFLVHFKQNSIIVNIDDNVVKGQELGKIGNSGNSSEAHLHYHLQTTSDPFNGDGLPAQFQNYYANDILVGRGEPERNERIKK